MYLLLPSHQICIWRHPQQHTNDRILVEVVYQFPQCCAKNYSLNGIPQHYHKNDYGDRLWEIWHTCVKLMQLINSFTGSQPPKYINRSIDGRRWMPYCIRWVPGCVQLFPVITFWNHKQHANNKFHRLHATTDELVQNLETPGRHSWPYVWFFPP